MHSFRYLCHHNHSLRTANSFYTPPPHPPPALLTQLDPNCTGFSTANKWPTISDPFFILLFFSFHFQFSLSPPHSQAVFISPLLSSSFLCSVSFIFHFNPSFSSSASHSPIFSVPIPPTHLLPFFISCSSFWFPSSIPLFFLNSALNSPFSFLLLLMLLSFPVPSFFSFCFFLVHFLLSSSGSTHCTSSCSTNIFPFYSITPPPPKHLNPVRGPQSGVGGGRGEGSTMGQEAGEGFSRQLAWSIPRGKEGKGGGTRGPFPPQWGGGGSFLIFLLSYQCTPSSSSFPAPSGILPMCSPSHLLPFFSLMFFFPWSHFLLLPMIRNPISILISASPSFILY